MRLTHCEYRCVFRFIRRRFRYYRRRSSDFLDRFPSCLPRNTQNRFPVEPNRFRLENATESRSGHTRTRPITKIATSFKSQYFMNTPSELFCETHRTLGIFTCRKKSIKKKMCYFDFGKFGFYLRDNRARSEWIFFFLRQ